MLLGLHNVKAHKEREGKTHQQSMANWIGIWDLWLWLLVDEKAGGYAK